MLLAGRASDARLEPSNPTGAKNWLSKLTGSQILDRRDDEWETEGADLFHALRVARIMRHPRNDQIGRILHQAEQWTIEMLALPPVWASVEKIACMLLEHGTITDRDAISEACTEILYMGITTPKWQRRLVPTLAERKAMAGPLDR